MEVTTRKRIPAVERMIEEIRDDDIRVRIIGMVVDSTNSILVLDDGTASINVSFDEKMDVKKGEIVRVIGRVIHTAAGKEIHGEILQKIEEWDQDIYRNLHRLWKEIKF